ncbi:MAG TPA: histidine phosphatase family protein, partial [Actinospica sp.]|nr:histidine phosphatase family protein [Actinospica sp.]
MSIRPEFSTSRQDPAAVGAAGRKGGTVRTLVLLRHGDSEWNAKNLFTGWGDVDLTPLGEQQACAAGRMLRAAGVLPDVLHT